MGLNLEHWFKSRYCIQNCGTLSCKVLFSNSPKPISHQKKIEEEKGKKEEKDEAAAPAKDLPVTKSQLEASSSDRSGTKNQDLVVVPKREQISPAPSVCEVSHPEAEPMGKLTLRQFLDFHEQELKVCTVYLPTRSSFPHFFFFYFGTDS